MPSIKISALTEKATMAGTEEVLINDSGTSKKFSTQRFLDIKTGAETAQTAAETAETNAETAETNASGSATSASGSATTATSQAVIATTKAGEASTSATSAIVFQMGETDKDTISTSGNVRANTNGLDNMSIVKTIVDVVTTVFVYGSVPSPKVAKVEELKRPASPLPETKIVSRVEKNNMVEIIIPIIKRNEKIFVVLEFFI
jgi:hypothetical protein